MPQRHSQNTEQIHLVYFFDFCTLDCFFLICLLQTLTRVSISRNSRREITPGFLSRAGEMNFHVSFSSQFSRFWENISLSPLVFWDFYSENLFLLSIFKILQNNFSFSSRFSRFCRTISFSPLDFQDFLEKCKFLLLNFKILWNNFSFSFRLRSRLKKSFSPLDIQDLVLWYFGWKIKSFC